jgi:hypothetical protein
MMPFCIHEYMLNINVRRQAKSNSRLFAIDGAGTW